MADHPLAYDESTKRLYLDLFTEIAILEHLVRQRFEPQHFADLRSVDFAVLNYFVRLGKNSEKLQTLAWCFQVETAAVRATVSELAARRLVEIDWVDGFECVFVTEGGRAKHAEAIADVAPDITEIMSEFDHADLHITTETLKEIRRTFDNLPDR
jgi:DNA-binding MarR family transcriptional regulator